MDKDNNIMSKVYAVIFMIVTAVFYFVNDKMMLSMLYGVLAVIAVALVKWLVLLPFTEAKKAKSNNILFYEKCVANGVHDLNSEKNRKRAELIAKDLGCTNIGDLNAFFEKGKQLSLQNQSEVQQKKFYAHLEELAQKEKEDHAKLTQYANCTGNQKTIQILTSELNALTSRYDTLSNFSEKASSVMLEREKDWATAGGIASGIAGGAAGLATALNVQAENAEIRARNDRNRAMIAQAQMHLNQSGQVQAVAGQISAKRNLLDQEKLKLVADLPEDTILRHLRISQTTVTISDTGAFRVKATVGMPDTLIIFEDLSARIDGTIICTISQNGKAVGEAEMVLPLFGVHPSKKSVQVEGICLNGAVPNVPCSVSFSGRKLYAIEN